MGNYLMKSCYSKRRDNDINNYTSAGCIFIEKSLVLSGYQKKKSKNIISGIGGKKENNDKNPIHTALREMIEELFNITTLSDKLFNELIEIKPKKTIVTKNHVNFIFTFYQLDEILEIMYDHKIKSNIYSIFPTCINELLFNRKINNNSEISHLCLLPIVKTKIIIDNDFMNDIYLLNDSTDICF
jgi:DNA-directed RNA polymerase subunit F